ncbi:MAG: gfo/Idh/MocA family oxidoreductase [Allomuricauda sp.]|nr:MAG: gfo/Idh/MocA family oxidoreductase [Allomuricauda sp.]
MRNKKIRWGLVGLGNIAKLFAEDLALVSEAELIAVASTDRNRAKEFAYAYGAAKFYGSYEALFNDKEVDIVYVATYHHTHAEVSIKAMNAGKHVLCEKPIATNHIDALAMIKASERNKVFFMEAFWSRFNPSIRKVKSLVEDDEIGKLKYLNAEFSFHVLNSDPKGRMLNPDLAGGSLLDMGVYPIFLSYLLLGKPTEILARSNFYKTGAEIQTAMIFQYKNAQAILYSGFANNTDMKAKIAGENGEIYITPVWHETQGFVLKKEGGEKYHDLPTKGKGFTYEIEECHCCINAAKKQSQNWSHENSFELISIVDEVRKQAGISFPFESP